MSQAYPAISAHASQLEPGALFATVEKAQRYDRDLAAKRILRHTEESWRIALLFGDAKLEAELRWLADAIADASAETGGKSPATRNFR